MVHCLSPYFKKMHQNLCPNCQKLISLEKWCSVPDSSARLFSNDTLNCANAPSSCQKIYPENYCLNILRIHWYPASGNAPTTLFVVFLYQEFALTMCHYRLEQASRKCSKLINKQSVPSGTRKWCNLISMLWLSPWSQLLPYVLQTVNFD